MKAREGRKYVLIDSTLKIQTVSEWVFQQVIFRSSYLLLGIVLVYGNVQTDNAVQLCSMITSLRQFSLKISTIYIFLFSKPFEVHKSTPFGLISLQNVVS